MKLKKIFLYSATMLLLVSCANEDKQGSSGYGAINVQVSADYKVVPATRALCRIDLVNRTSRCKRICFETGLFRR